MLETLINLTPIQVNYLNDDSHRFMIVSAGRRSRKTLIAKRKMIFRAWEKQGRYFHAAPTYMQAKRIFWESLKADTREIISYKSDSELFVRLKNRSEIHVAGLDRPERIEGQVWHGCHITEFANLKPMAWSSNIRPVLSDTRGWAILDGVPEGRNFYYDMALYASGGALPQTIEQVGSYAENPNDNEWCFYSWFSKDVLDKAEIDAVKGELDEKTFRQEYEGSFENFEGVAYYNFGSHNLKTVVYNSKDIIHVGMDFNVNPMTAVLCHVYANEVHQFGELYMRNSNTYEMVKELTRMFPANRVIIYPDSTGKARESNATYSDLEILKRAGFQIRAHPTNPYVKDRLNAVNSLMKPMNGKVRYYVNPECVKTINDFNKVERTADGRENKRQEDEGLVHISSALGYLIYYLFPLKNSISITGG